MKNTIAISLLLCFLLQNTTVLAQSEQVSKYIPKTAQVILSFRPSQLGALFSQEEWAAQTWLQEFVQPLQLSIMGKRKVRELIGTLTHFPTTVGIDTASHWHFVSERDSLGISKYTLFMPMLQISAWLDFVQKSMPLYTNSDLKLSISTIFYVQRDNFVIAWNREHIRISGFILPNNHQYTPTYVEHKMEIERNILPRLLPMPEFSLRADTAYLRQLSAPNQSFCLRLIHKNQSAIMSVVSTKNETILQYQQSQNNPIFALAYLLNIRKLQFDLRRIAPFAAFFPPRAAYAPLADQLAQLPPLTIETIAPRKYNFKIAAPLKDLLLLWQK